MGISRDGGAILHGARWLREKERAAFEFYGGRLTEQESACLVRFGFWAGVVAVLGALALPVALFAPHPGGLAAAPLVFPIIFAIFIPPGLMATRNLNQVTSSLARRHELDPKAARRIEFRKGLEKFDETLAEAKRKSASKPR